MQARTHQHFKQNSLVDIFEKNNFINNSRTTKTKLNRLN